MYTYEITEDNEVLIINKNGNVILWTFPFISEQEATDWAILSVNNYNRDGYTEYDTEATVETENP